MTVRCQLPARHPMQQCLGHTLLLDRTWLPGKRTCPPQMRIMPPWGEEIALTRYRVQVGQELTWAKALQQGGGLAGSLYLHVPCKSYLPKLQNMHFPPGPVVKNLPSNVANEDSILGQGTKIRHATGQLSPYATTREALLPQQRAGAAKKKKKPRQ